jgi:DNA-binding CsgD family transcriptional regulator
MTTWSERLFPRRTNTTPRGAGETVRSRPALDAAIEFVAAVYGTPLAVLPEALAACGRPGGAGTPEDVAIRQVDVAAEHARSRARLALIDHLPFALVVCDGAAHVVLANAAGACAIRAHATLTTIDGLLGTIDGVVTERLRAAIARVCSAPSSEAAVTIVPLSSGIARAQLIVIGFPSGFEASCAAVVFPDPERLSGAAKLVASLYSLTPAQARLAMLILEGRTLVEAAHVLGICNRTAVETWKVVRAKLRTRNDSECLHLLRAALIAGAHES